MKPAQSKQPQTITVHIPMSFAMRGGRKTIIGEIPRTHPRPTFDSALIKALARAHRWRKKIEAGEYVSITELAKAEGVNQSYACRLLRLTLLAPDLVTGILDGRQELGLTLCKLTVPVPIIWAEQGKIAKI